MANLLAHALFALAVFSVPSALSSGAPLTPYGFYAAFASLAPDLEGTRGGTRTPLGHSVATGLLWGLLVLSTVSLAGWTGFWPAETVSILIGACLTGLASHLFLDAVGEPGIFTWPHAAGPWGRFVLLVGHRPPGLNLLISSLSTGTLLTMLLLY